jgi:hypothetical protein
LNSEEQCEFYDPCQYHKCPEFSKCREVDGKQFAAVWIKIS